MKIIRSLLEQYVDIPQEISNQELMDLITLHIAEVEDMVEEEKQFENIVVGLIKEIHPHPNADSLKLTKVDVGEGELVQILCGGTNVEEGKKVIVAKLGAAVHWHGEEEVTIMKKAKIRGEESLGMICAADEVLLDDVYSHENKEIVVLPEDAPVGRCMADYLDKKEVIYDIDNKSLTHRPDLWGYYGFARDIAAMLEVPFKSLDIKPMNGSGEVAIQNKTKDLCSCFAFQSFKIGAPKESPKWIQNALTLSGMKPINSIVDITNLVMLELGQPVHAYDISEVQGTIVVQKAKQDETFVTLDDIERKLCDTDIVIADDTQTLGIAGVMGGQNSEIKDSTSEILLEAATFDPVSIRKTSSRLGIYTEAARRFEKSLDPCLPELTIARFAQLLKEVHGNDFQVTSSFTQLKEETKEIIIEYRPTEAERVIGHAIENQENILEKLQFEVDSSSLPWKITIPSWRATKDVSIEADIVEEVVRMTGYDTVVGEPFSEEVVFPVFSANKQVERLLGEILTGMGFYQAMTYSFVGKSVMDKFGETMENSIALRNSISNEFTHLRTSILYNLAGYVDRSLLHIDEVKAFEIGHVFENTNGIEEKNKCMLIMTIPDKKGDANLFQDAQATCESILNKLKYSFQINPTDSIDYAHPVRQCTYSRGREELAKVYEMHPSITKEWKWKKTRVAVIELNIEFFAKNIGKLTKYKQPSSFPNINKGISILFDEKVLLGELTQKLSKISPLIRTITIPTIYQGIGVPEGKKSVAMEVVYGDDKRTLEEKDVENIHKNIIETIEKKGGDIQS